MGAMTGPVSLPGTMGPAWASFVPAEDARRSGEAFKDRSSENAERPAEKTVQRVPFAPGEGLDPPGQDEKNGKHDRALGEDTHHLVVDAPAGERGHGTARSRADEDTGKARPVGPVVIAEAAQAPHLVGIDEHRDE